MQPIERRYDIDWLRVIAFGLLILFHAGLVYAPFDWHIHSRHTENWLREGILLSLMADRGSRHRRRRRRGPRRAQAAE